MNGSPGGANHERSPGNAGVSRKDSRSGNVGHHRLLDSKDKNAVR
jgi:hypothetical protein